MFHKIRPRKISDEVYEQIKDLIMSGRLQPGQKLPSERDLSVELGVSRPSLREAIQKLDAQGFLEQIQGDGTYVRSIAAQSMDHALEAFIKRDDAIFDLMKMRKILETWAASEAAARAQPDQIDFMRKALAEMEDNRRYGTVGAKADIRFHNGIFQGTNNLLLAHIMRTINEWLEKVSFEVRSRMYRDPDAHLHLFEQHQAVFNAIKSGDSAVAYDAMLRHMEYVERELRKIYGEVHHKADDAPGAAV